MSDRLSSDDRRHLKAASRLLGAVARTCLLANWIIPAELFTLTPVGFAAAWPVYPRLKASGFEIVERQGHSLLTPVPRQRERSSFLAVKRESSTRYG